MMADLKLNYANTEGPESAYEVVKTSITPETIEKFKVKASFDYRDSDKEIVAKGSGFELNIQFLDDGAHLTLNLSILFRAFRPKILESLERKLSKVI
jgi:hypothetical protein